MTKTTTKKEGGIVRRIVKMLTMPKENKEPGGSVDHYDFVSTGGGGG